MKKHLNRILKCGRVVDSYKIKDEEIESESLKNESIENKCFKSEIETKYKIMDYDNIENINDLILYINTNKINKCKFCNHVFSRNYELIRHLKTSCKKYKNLINNDNIKENEFKDYDKYNEYKNNIGNLEDEFIKNDFSNENINITLETENISQTKNVNIQNISNQTNNNQTINNNITINVYNNDPNNIIIIPFDQKWDISKIDDNKKLKLLFEDSKYSSTLKELLNNDKNKNIIFDKDNNLGLIYKNEDEKFINMNTTEIMDKTMLKIYNHLIEFYDDIKDKENNILNALEPQKNIVIKKYQEYDENKDKKTKEIVKNIMIDIFDENKDKVIQRFIQFNNQNEKENIDNYELKKNIEEYKKNF